MERAIKKVAIAGAGVMGSSIAQYFAERGLEVIVYDIVQASLDKIDQTICENQQLLIERGALTVEQAAEARARVTTTSTLEDFAQVDLVIEAIIENMAIKQDFFRQLENRIDLAVKISVIQIIVLLTVNSYILIGFNLENLFFIDHLPPFNY